MILRPYQEQAVACALDAFNSHRACLIVLPTGTGKTVIFAHIVKELRNRGRALIIAHREELLIQAGDKIERVMGVKPDLEMADAWASDGMWKSPVVLSTVQTQTSGRTDKRRMHRFDPNEFGLVVIDEAHHAPAATYREVVAHYEQNPMCHILGVTATPDRADEKALGQVFDICAFEYSIQQAIQEGYLTPVLQEVIYIESLDISKCNNNTFGDINSSDLEKALGETKVLWGIASATMEHSAGKKTLVFSDSVANAARLTAIFNEQRPHSAEVITGETDTDTRRRIIADFRVSKFPTLVNVGIATEGFDVPDIECVALARPTKSRSLYAQMLGRGTRPLDGLVDQYHTDVARRAAIAASAKPALLALDFVGVSGQHKLIHAADVLGGDYSQEVIDLAERNAEGRNGPTDVLSELAIAQEEINKQKEALRIREQERLAVKAKTSKRNVDPFAVFGIEPREGRGWEQAIDDNTKALLERNRVDDWEKLTPTQCYQIRDEIRARVRRGHCSYRMARTLKRYGYDTHMPFEEAHALMGQLEANGWKPLAKKVTVGI